MAAVVFYCVNTWRTCQKAKAWLSQNNVDFEYRDLLKEPPDLKELKQIAHVAGVQLADLVNTKSQAYKKLQPDLTVLDDEGIAALIAGEPRLLKRPVLIQGKKFLSGFKEKEYEELL